jgi:hypothetical protein
VKSESRIAELYLQPWVTPEETGHPIAPPSKTVLLRLAAALGADFTAVQQAFVAAKDTVKGGHWNHFAQGDHVLVFGEPDPANTSRRVRCGIVIDPPSLDIIGIAFAGEGNEEFSPADPVRVHHVGGTCQCVVAIS